MSPKSYILMKASRLPGKGIASLSDAYLPSRKLDLKIQAAQSYLDFSEATVVALALQAENPVGWNIWVVGEVVPSATTLANYYFANQAIPSLENSKLKD